MPLLHSSRTNTAVSSTYTPSVCLTVAAIVVDCFPVLSAPDASAVYRLYLLIPSLGTSASTSNTIPKPPNHCVMLRQNSTDAGSHSTALNTVAPVDVMPLVDSNSASTTPLSVPVVRNGSMPNSASTAHISTTSTYAIRLCLNAFAPPKVTLSQSPTANVKAPLSAMLPAVPSSKCNAGTRQHNISTPSTISTMPKNRSIYFTSSITDKECVNALMC